MDKNLAGLIGVASLLATSAHAANAPPLTLSDAMQASSYADLLKPIPNAVALLKASDAAPARIAPAEPTAEGDATVQPVQYWYYPRYYPRDRYYHHHHHHHRYYHHHHHHHHHHHS